MADQLSDKLDWNTFQFTEVAFGDQFTVHWSGSDDASGPPGSGIATFDVFVSDNGGPFTPFQMQTSATFAPFTGQLVHTYGFFSVATDNVGHRQPTPVAAQTMTTLANRPPSFTGLTLNPAGNIPVTSIKLMFSEPLAQNADSDPTNLTNYRLFGVGRDKLPGTLATPGDDTTLPIVRATLGDANSSVTLSLARPIKTGQFFRIVVFANGPLTDSADNHFDGNGDGTSGDASSTTLARGTKISFSDSDRDKVTLTLSGGSVMQLTLAPSRDAVNVALVGAKSSSVLTGTVKRPKIGATAANGKTPRPTITNPNRARINLSNPPFVPNLSAIVVNRLLESGVPIHDSVVEYL